MNKKAIVVYCIADQNNFKYALIMLKSLRKFHDWPVLLYTNETNPEKLKKLPKDILLVDLNPYLQDPMFFYRATPILGEKLLDEYELVVKIDADSLILGDLSYILETRDYDVGTVINWNRYDSQFFPPVEMIRIGIAPVEYFNCGFVAMRSKKFAHNWTVWCFSPNFDRCQYKEQDGLNILCYSGNWNIRCFDHPNGLKKFFGWFGLIGKGEWVRSELRGKDIIVPKGFGPQAFPPADVTIKIAHCAGGTNSPKDNWSAFFPPKVMEYINEIIK